MAGSQKEHYYTSDEITYEESGGESEEENEEESEDETGEESDKESSENTGEDSGKEAAEESGDKMGEESGTGSDQILNKINNVNKKTMHIIKTDTDTEECSIINICEATEDRLFILDSRNKKVKLVDLKPSNKTSNTVVNEIKLKGKPYCMCSIDTGQVAVTAIRTVVRLDENGEKYRKQLFIIYYIENNKEKGLWLHKIADFQTECRGIAHHKDTLYITSGTALYKELDGAQTYKMLYEDTSDEATGNTVTSCAVSRDGSSIYVVNQLHNSLVTVSSEDGTVISTLSPGDKFEYFQWGYKRWKAMPGLRVTDTGEILVCGGKKNTLLQITSDGKAIKHVMDTQEKHGVCRPRSVYYNKNTGALIVGVWKNDIFFVFSSSK